MRRDERRDTREDGVLRRHLCGAKNGPERSHGEKAIHGEADAREMATVARNASIYLDFHEDKEAYGW